jgi:hypothetical protein
MKLAFARPSFQAGIGPKSWPPPGANKCECNRPNRGVNAWRAPIESQFLIRH